MLAQFAALKEFSGYSARRGDLYAFSRLLYLRRKRQHSGKNETAKVLRAESAKGTRTEEDSSGIFQWLHMWWMHQQMFMIKLCEVRRLCPRRRRRTLPGVFHRWASQGFQCSGRSSRSGRPGPPSLETRTLGRALLRAVAGMGIGAGWGNTLHASLCLIGCMFIHLNGTDSGTSLFKTNIPF